MMHSLIHVILLGLDLEVTKSSGTPGSDAVCGVGLILRHDSTDLL